MPSPLGHALGGIAAAWLIDVGSGHGHGRWFGLGRGRRSRRPGRRLPAPPGRRPPRGSAQPVATSCADRAGGAVTLVCAGVAVLPDTDLLFGVHRTASHSISAAVLVTIVAALVTGRVTHRGTHVRVALMCGAAYASHLLLDWLAVDRYPPSGMQLLWPFSHRWFISGLDLFPATQRYRVWSAAAVKTNLIACAWEMAILLPIVMLLWITTRRLERSCPDPGSH